MSSWFCDWLKIFGVRLLSKVKVQISTRIIFRMSFYELCGNWFFYPFFFFCGKYICLFTEEPKKTGWWCFRKIVWKCKSNSLCEDYFSCWYNCLFWTYWWLWVYSPFQLTYFHLMSELSMRVCSCITYSWEGVYLESWIHCQRPGIFSSFNENICVAIVIKLNWCLSIATSGAC